MKAVNFKKIAAVSVLGLAAVLGTGTAANAQGRRGSQKQEKKIIKQQQKIIKQQQKIQAQRAKIAPRPMPIQPNRQGTWNNANANYNRYRVYRNGSYYNTDNRGAELLRQAVNAGYQQGFQAGQHDRSSRRGGTWTSNGVYRSGTYGYQSYVDRSQYQYYFQQGFQRGYQDGYNSRQQYGYNSGGTMNILGSILNSLLNIQQY